MTLHGSRRVGDKGRVVAIEPHPMMFERLSGHLALNNCHNVRALQLAAGAHHGTATLYDVPAVAIGRASLLKPEAKHVASGVVQVVTLDSILSEYPSIRFLKIDIEGYEAQALAGAAETLRKQPVICMEVVRSHGGDPFAAHEAIISTGLYEPFVFSGGKSKASSLVPLLDHKGIRHDNVVYIPLGESAAMLRG